MERVENGRVFGSIAKALDGGIVQCCGCRRTSPG